MMRAGAKRTQTRSAFIEDFIDAKGDGSGAQAAWGRYIEENPIFENVNGGGITVNQPAPYDSYIPGNAESGSDPISMAKAAIERGADRGAVLQRLKEYGINPGDL